MDRKLINYLPYVVRDYAEFQGITGAEQPEFENAWAAVDDLLNNQFIKTAGNSKVANNHTSTTSAVWWWLRSPDYDADSVFCNVNHNGDSYNNNAYYSAGVLPGFAV